MVGIVLASHGSLAEGMRESSQMIFGPQEDVVSVTLAPDMGPDDFHAALQDAVDSLGDQGQVLFLADLWGGTPFNQVSRLIEEHKKDGWVVVTGLSLPMLISAYGERMGAETAMGVAQVICVEAADGIRMKPEPAGWAYPSAQGQGAAGSEGAAAGMGAPAGTGAASGGFSGATSAPGISASADPAAQAGAASIPEGTVFGDGHLKIVLARIDTRLLHGQVATTWTKTVRPDRIIVCSDAVAHDELRKSMIEQAAPPGVRAHVVPIEKIIEVAHDPRFGATRAMLLFETPQDLLRALEGGVDIREVNIGSMAHSAGKVVVTNAIAMGPEDIQTLEAIEARGVVFDVRKVPADSPVALGPLIQKARSELGKS